MSFQYFAYGSNMLTARLQRRCSGAIPVGPAEARDWALEFSKPSFDDSGKATLRQSPRKRALGVVFRIPFSELRALDAFEGAGHGYERCDTFPVRLVETGELLETTTYLATSSDTSLKPYDWYLALIVAGAREHQLGANHVRVLQRVKSVIDPNRNRMARHEALAVLSQAGYRDYFELVPRVWP